MENIKKIIYDTNWEETDFKTKNEIYKNEAFSDFFIYDRSYIISIFRHYFYSKIKQNFYNKFEFFPEEFEKQYYKTCIRNKFYNYDFQKLTSFIINGYIYGYYTEEQAQNISDLFESNNNIENFGILLKEVENYEIEPTPESFINWINDIIELNENKEVEIKAQVYNISNYDCSNFGITYIKFNESELNVTLSESILEKVEKEGKLIALNLFKYRDIFFELIFYDSDKHKEAMNTKEIKYAWNSTLYNNIMNIIILLII